MKKTIVIIGMIGLLCAGVVYAAVQEQEEQAAGQQTFTAAEEIGASTYELPQSDEAYLTDLMEKGYRSDWLEEIYRFWLTCGEDISIIEEIYRTSEEQNLNGRYWVEESYNVATNQAHGVLDVAQVGEYLGKSITRDQISKANVLSRQGVYTITEILDQLLQGKTWSELVNAVYGAGTVPANAVYLDVEGIAKIKKQSGLSPIADVVSDYYTFEEASAMQNMYGGNQVIRSAYGDGSAALICMPKKQLGEIKLGEHQKSNKKTVEDARRAGVSQQELDTLGKEYSADKIYRAQEIGKENNKTATQVLEEYEQDGAWSKLLKEGE